MQNVETPAEQAAFAASSSPDATPAQEQYAALCYRTDHGKREILLITSRDTGRWVLPKGWPIKGLTPAESAAREAWEEAGVCGKPGKKCAGLYSYDKALGPEKAVHCVVSVYPIKVEKLRDNFPEAGQRKRKWFSPKKAARNVAEPELSRLLLSLADKS